MDVAQSYEESHERYAIDPASDVSIELDSAIEGEQTASAAQSTQGAECRGLHSQDLWYLLRASRVLSHPSRMQLHSALIAFSHSARFSVAFS